MPDDLIQLKAMFYDIMVLRHPGHGNQKVHGNRFGPGQAKESLRRLKDDKGARERYKETARASVTPDYKRAKGELDKAVKLMGGAPESEWGELDRDYINDLKTEVNSELQLSKVAKKAGYDPSNMTPEKWSKLSGELKSDANSSLRNAFEESRQSAGDKIRGQKDTWMQVGGQAVMGRSGRSAKEARQLVSDLNQGTKAKADEYMSKELAKMGYSKKTLNDLDYSQKRRLMAEIGHGQLQSGAISGVSTADRRRVLSGVSASDRSNASSTAMNPRAGEGMEIWTYYEQSALKAGKQPDLIPDYLMNINALPDYVRYAGGRNPYTQPQRVEEIDF